MKQHPSGSDLELSVRAAKVAKRVGATTVRDLVRFTEDELFSTSCFGETSLKEIRAKLAERGLRLGMTSQELAARTDVQGHIVVQANPGASPPGAAPEHEAECCPDCGNAARMLRERLAAAARDGREPERQLGISLAELELSVRLTNCLEAEGTMTVRDLGSRTAEELLEVPNFGETALQEVKAKLARRGLQLASISVLAE